MKTMTSRGQLLGTLALLLAHLTPTACTKETPELTPSTPEASDITTPSPRSSRGQDPAVTRVLDYRPGGGQFVNVYPEYTSGDTQERMNAKALAILRRQNNDIVSLGGFGGYIVVGFDHTIQNIPGRRDFQVRGNSLIAYENDGILEDPTTPNGQYRIGSSEPGVIMVAYDANKNGRPDPDEWYEIAGSSSDPDAMGEPWIRFMQDRNYETETIRDYAITYERPKVETGNNDTYLRWTDNLGGSGYIPKNMWHKQSYYPKWINENSYTLTGILLPQNGLYRPDAKSYKYVQLFFEYGYADNVPNEEVESKIDIDWAIDRNGNPVHLPGVDFIRIHTGINQVNGWLGECSTEVSGIEDLHLLGQNIPTR